MMLSIKMNVKVNEDRKIEIQLPSEVSEGDHEMVLIIDNLEKRNKKSLRDFVGKIDWPMDGMDYQNQIRSEWK
ncbi:MAG: hypothetical protein O9346_11400 [Leptospiraceae bacterium]|jgi:hypothetical protein|nr:hypothetical protein [Leptospiraceae bacterium]